MWMTHGSAYLEGFFVGDNYERFATARFNDPRPWWFYLPVLAGGLLPWTPLHARVAGAGPAVSHAAARHRHRRSAAAAVGGAAAGLLHAVGRQAAALHPAGPAAGGAAARRLDHRAHHASGAASTARACGRARIGAVVVGCVLGGAVPDRAGACCSIAREPLFIDVADDDHAGRGRRDRAPAALVVVVVSLTQRLARGARRCWPLPRPSRLRCCPTACLPAPRDAAVRQMAAAGPRRAHRAAKPIGTYRVFVRNLVFYTGLKQTDIIHDEHLTDWLSTATRARWSCCRSTDLERLERERGLRFERLGESGISTRAARVGTLLWPDPSAMSKRSCSCASGADEPASRDRDVVARHALQCRRAGHLRSARG